MKILAFTDMHADAQGMKQLKAKSAKADLIVCCGDFTVFGRGLKKILSEFDKIGKKMLIVHGNHEDEFEVEYECKKSKNLTFIHKKFHEHGKLVICGYGGGGFSQKDHEFEMFSEEIEQHMNSKNGKLLLMAFHMPPYKTKQDHLPMGHVGSKSYTNFIIKHQPLMALCGHIEENNGEVDKIGNTTILNPGPEGRIIEINFSDSGNRKD